MHILSKDFLPDRYGFFTEAKKAVSYTLDKYSLEEFTHMYLAEYDKYVTMKLPFGTSLMTPNEEAVGDCIDLDHHKCTLADIMEKYHELCKFLSQFNMGAELSGRGIHIWILFTKPIKFSLLKLFNEYIVKKFSYPKDDRFERGVEVYPSSKPAFIRYPGLYKDKQSYSRNMLDGTVLDTIEKVTAFWGTCQNDPEVVLGIIKQLGLYPDDTADKPKPNRKEKVISSLDSFIHGLDKYFDVIWEHIHRIPVPTGVFKCPYHEDDNPSAKVYKNDSGKWIFVCNASSCPMFNEKETIGRDALDILHMHKHHNLMMSGETIGECQSYLCNRIIKYKFAKWLIPCKDEGLMINYMEVADDIIKEMRQPEAVDVRRDRYGVLYTYNGEYLKHWVQVDEPKCETDIIHKVTMDTLSRMTSPQCIWYPGRSNLDYLVSMVNRQLHLPEDRFEPDIRSGLLLPFKNGVVDMNKYMAGDKEGCLLPSSKSMSLTSTMGCNYTPGARNEMFTDTVKRYLPIPIRQRIFSLFIAACLFPSIPLQKILFCVGTGGNGKGTLLSIIAALFGERAGAVKFSDLNKDFHSFGIYNKAINIDPDATMGAMDPATVALIKTITGDGSITMNRKFANPIVVEPTAKFLVACNAMPGLGEANEAIARRECILAFTEKVPRDNVGGFWRKVIPNDKALAGVANYFMDYVQDLIKSDYQIPIEENEQSKEDQFSQSDPIYGYLVSIFEKDLNNPIKYPTKEARLDNAALTKGVASDQLFRDFMIYTTQVNIATRMSGTKFARRLPEILHDKLLPEYLSKRITSAKIHNWWSYTFDISPIA